jgi:general secretion pathway protein K
MDLNPALAQAISDWLDADQEPLFPDGAEDSAYLSRGVGYLTANRPLVSVSELRLVAGCDADTYAKLSPYVSALPAPTAVNVNTAEPLVLAALDTSLSLAAAQDLVAKRPDEGYASVAEYRQAAGLAPIVDETLLSVTSDYFLLHAQATVGTAQVSLSSLLRRSAQDNAVLARSFSGEPL